MNLFKRKIEESSAELVSLQTENETLKASLKEAQDSAANHLLRITELNETVSTLTAENERLNSENAELAGNTATVEIAAAEIVASAGIPPIEITSDENQKSILEQLATLKGKERQDFYNTHKTEIFNLLSK